MLSLSSFRSFLQKHEILILISMGVFLVSLFTQGFLIGFTLSIFSVKISYIGLIFLLILNEWTDEGDIFIPCLNSLGWVCLSLFAFLPAGLISFLSLVSGLALWFTGLGVKLGRRNGG